MTVPADTGEGSGSAWENRQSRQCPPAIDTGESAGSGLLRPVCTCQRGPELEQTWVKDARPGSVGPSSRPSTGTIAMPSINTKARQAKVRCR